MKIATDPDKGMFEHFYTNAELRAEIAQLKDRILILETELAEMRRHPIETDNSVL